MGGMLQWDYKVKIEDMTEAQLKERIRAAMDFQIEHAIQPIPYIAKESEVVEYATEELIARCPVTGYPDFYTLRLRYIPDKLIPELKSLKFYLMDYADLPISHEHLAAKIYGDFIQRIDPEVLRLELDVSSRGGIVTKVVIGIDLKL